MFPCYHTRLQSLLHVYVSCNTPYHSLFLIHIRLHFLKMNCLLLKMALANKYSYYSVITYNCIWKISPSVPDFFFPTSLQVLDVLKSHCLNVQLKCLLFKTMYFLKNRGQFIPPNIVNSILVPAKKHNSFGIVYYLATLDNLFF